MDFKDQEIDFREADRRYAELTQQRDTGTISDEEFEAQRQRLMVLDGEGRWWAKSRGTGEWRYHDGNAWLPGTPPGYEEDITETPSSQAQTAPGPKKVGGRRRRMPLWIPVVGIGGLVLIGIVLAGWVLAPSLQGIIAPDEQAPDEQAGPAPDGAAFDAAFVHRATPENISANSTYLDNPLTNGDPNAIVYVTQNWNPEDSSGTYNNRPIGVWYDSDRERWAIFNQDRAAMPEGADFNVGIIKEAQQE